MLNNSLNTLLQAILQTVMYSDLFDYPLTAEEIHRYLSGIHASPEEVQRALFGDNYLTHIGEYFTLPGRDEIVDIRKQREVRSRQLLPVALHYGHLLGKLPFIRMVALTGSLAVLNVSNDVDFDYMLVTAPGRLWTARAFALLLNRFVRLFGHTICPNLIVSENKLEWRQHDLYSARELCQMIPITGMDIYRRLINANEWVREFLPNAFPFLESNSLLFDKWEQAPLFQKFLELPLRGKFGDYFEQWEMTRKIPRFSKQAGFGEETVFNAEICQGNFDHHRQWTQEMLEEKFMTLNALGGVELEALSPRTAMES